MSERAMEALARENGFDEALGKVRRLEITLEKMKLEYTRALSKLRIKKNRLDEREMALRMREIELEGRIHAFELRRTESCLPRRPQLPESGHVDKGLEGTQESASGLDTAPPTPHI